MFWFICQCHKGMSEGAKVNAAPHLQNIQSHSAQRGEEDRRGKEVYKHFLGSSPHSSNATKCVFFSGINKITVAIYWTLAMCQHFPSNISLNLLRNSPYRLAALSALSSFSRRKLWLRQVKWCVQDHTSLRSLTHCLKKTVHPPHLPFWQWITQSS